MATEKCKTCANFWALEKPLPKGGVKKLSRGHCLKRSIFPANKPGNPVYPPNAIIKDLPFNRAQPYLVKEDDVLGFCTDYEGRPQ